MAQSALRAWSKGPKELGKQSRASSGGSGSQFQALLDQHLEDLKTSLLQLHSEEVQRLTGRQPKDQEDATSDAPCLDASSKGRTPKVPETRSPTFLAAASPRSSKNSSSWVSPDVNTMSRAETSKDSNLLTCIDRPPPFKMDMIDLELWDVGGNIVHNWERFCLELRHKQELAESTDAEHLHLREHWQVALKEASGHDLHTESTKNSFASGKKSLWASAVSAGNIEDLRLLESSSWIQCLVIHPQSYLRFFWAFLGVIAIICDCAFIPLGVFDVGATLEIVLFYSSTVTFSYWAFDLLLNFFTGTEGPNGIGAEMRPSVLVRRYVRTWFFPDLCLLLLDAAIIVVASSMKQGQLMKYVRVLRTIRFLRFVRLFRISKLSNSFTRIAVRYTSVYFWISLQILKGLTVILIINHYLALGWMAIGLSGDRHNNWIEIYGLAGTRNFEECYPAALHWTLTQFMPATNNISPTNVNERWFAVFIVLVGMGFFSSLISTMTNTVNALRAVRMSRTAAEAKVRQFFNERDMPAELLLAVLKTFSHRQNALSSRLVEADVTLVCQCPESLRVKIHHAMFAAVLRQSVWFSSAVRMRDSVANEFVAKVCHFTMVEKLVNPLQDVFLEGLECDHVFILQNGDFSYTTQPAVIRSMTSLKLTKQKSIYSSESSRHSGGSAPSRVEIQTTLSNSEWLCEIAIWTQWLHKGQLTALGLCNYAAMDTNTFSGLAVSSGGRVYEFLRIFGILLVDHIERLRWQATDLAIDLDDMKAMSGRVLAFEQIDAECTRSLTEEA